METFVAIIGSCPIVEGFFFEFVDVSFKVCEVHTR